MQKMTDTTTEVEIADNGEITAIKGKCKAKDIRKKSPEKGADFSEDIDAMIENCGSGSCEGF